MRQLWWVVLACVLSFNAVAGLDEGIAAYENEEFELAVAELLPLARSGNQQAMTWLGKAYADGLDKPAQALPWYLKAAQSGVAEAQVRLAEFYAEGLVVEQDDEQAEAWFGRAAEQGDDEGQFALGLHHEEVLGDNATAAVWYEKAARQGNPDAQYRLGLLLLGEPGVARHAVRAWMFLSLAADDGLNDAAQARDVLELGMKPKEREEARALLRDWLQGMP